MISSLDNICVSKSDKTENSSYEHVINTYTKYNILNFDKEELKNIGEEYCKKMKGYSNDAERTTDKFPKNFLSIGFIKLILQTAKIIHCERNPKDTIFSIFKNHFTSGQVTFAYDLNEIVEYYNLYHNLMDYWNEILPNFIFNIKYEELISNTEAKRPPYCAGIPPFIRLISFIASALKTEKKPNKCEAL